MSKAKHTPGEWVVMPGTSAPRICVDGDPEWPIVVTISGHSDAGIKANAHLIATAPELYEMIDQINAAFYNRTSRKEWLALMEKTKPLLQKARGES